MGVPVPERLSALDASFLYLEEASTPMHVGGVAIFAEPEDGFDYDRLVQLLRERIAFVPRYRQRVREVPGHFAGPVWVDDADFDITYHVRRSALPRPGTDTQLWELVARIMSRRLDRDRPLWEFYLVEGLTDRRFAIITKTHHAVVDGATALEIGQVILDTSPDARQPRPVRWRPAAEPSGLELVAGAAADIVRRPTELLDVVRAGAGDLRLAAGRTASAVGGVLSVLRTATRSTPASPLNAEIGKARRFTTATVSLTDLKRVKTYHDTTVNDVVLAVVSGALRSWLMMRGEVVRTSTTLRALVPVSVRGAEQANMVGQQVAAYLVDLPIGEPSPVVRLQRIAFAMRGHAETGQAVAAKALTGLAGFSPPTLHALGARVAGDLSRRGYNLVVTNVPGPQVPLYAGGALMLGAYPVVPLARHQALSIGVTSYNGVLCFGLNGDREAMSDIDTLAEAIDEAVNDLLDTVRTQRLAVRSGMRARRGGTPDVAGG
jgi:WS/DGAT/MGAT family acyltransferase